MQRSKIYAILGNFTRSELTEFRKFLISPFFNKSHNVIKLFDLLRLHHPEFSSRVLSDQILHRKIFKGDGFSPRTIDNLVTILLKLCDKFMAINSLRSTSGYFEISLLEQYKKKKLDSLLKNKLTSLIKTYNPEKVYNADQYYYFMKLNFHYADYIFNHMHLEKKNNLFDALISDFKLINKYSYFYKVRLFSRLAIGVLSANHRIELYPDLAELINDISSCTDTNINPAAKIYSSIAKSMLNQTKFDYISLKNELSSIQNKITKEDFDLALTLLAFYFYPQINESDSNLVRKRFEHLKFMIERKVWNALEGNLKENIFSFVVYSAIKAGEIGWAENFIKFHSIYIFAYQRENAINYNMALLNYSKAKYDKLKETEYIDKALYYLNRFHIHDFTNKLHVFRLKTMIFFDLEQFDTLYFESIAFDQFLINNKEHLNKNIYESYFDYSKYLKNLSQYIINENINKAKVLCEIIRNNESVENREWLLDKLNSFIRKKEFRKTGL